MESSNPYDKASRYLLKVFTLGVLAWILGSREIAFKFQRWLDTRRVVLPGEPDRICDSIAELELGPGEYWALVCEVNRSPKSTMFGRMLVYLGLLWLDELPTNQRGERYNLAGVIVNLTGRGHVSAQHRLMPGVGTELQVREVNLIERDAELSLDEVARDPIYGGILPWIPLMQNGSTEANRARWLELASLESNSEVRADLGALVLTFAGLAGTLQEWKRTLEGWNVEISLYLQEREQIAELRVLKRTIFKLLSARFADGVSAEIRETVQAQTDATILDTLVEMAGTTDSLSSFKTALDRLEK